MKLTLHIPSVLIGLLLAGLLGMVMGQGLTGSSGVEISRVIEPVVAHPRTHPSNFVQIHEGAPYTVPPGKILFLQSHGWLTTGSAFGAHVEVDGVSVFGSGGGNLAQSAYYFDPGYIVREGSVVEYVDDGNEPDTDGVVLGYLTEG